MNESASGENRHESGRIHVLAGTMSQISEDFLFEKRGCIEVKGEGCMEAWCLQKADQETL
jgi:hypothetical protein